MKNIPKKIYLQLGFDGDKPTDFFDMELEQVPWYDKRVYNDDIEYVLATESEITNAPELLDFINRISGEMLRNDFVLSEKWYEQARKLIDETVKGQGNDT